MKISPINNQISYKAVNQKYLQKAVEKYAKNAPYHNQGHLLTMLEFEVYYKLISYQDAIDTLEAIKPYAQNALEVIDDMINRFNKKFKNNKL